MKLDFSQHRKLKSKLNIAGAKDKSERKAPKDKSELPFFQQIHFKLMAGFLLPIICIIVLGTASYLRASSAIVSSYESSVSQTMHMMGQYLDLAFSSVQTNYKFYLTDETELNYYLSGIYKDDNIKTAAVQSQYTTNLNAIPTKNNLVSNIYVLSGTADSFTTTKGLQSGLYDSYAASAQGSEVKSDAYNFHWYGNVCEADEALGTKSSDYSVRLARHFANDKAILIIDFAPSVVKDALASLDAGDGSVVRLITSDGTEYSAQEDDDTSTIFASSDFYADAFASENTSDTKYVTYNGSSYLYVYNKLEEGDAMICALIPESTIISQAADIKRLTVILVLIAVIIAAIISTLISNGIGKTIHNFNHQLRKVAKGDLTVNVSTKRKDEFLLLANGINSMIFHMKDLLQSVNNVYGELTTSVVQVSASSETFVQTAHSIQESINEITIGAERLDSDSDDCLVQMDSLSDKIGTVTENTSHISDLTTSTEHAVSKGLSSMDGLTQTAKATTDITAQVIDAITVLEEKSRSISQIVNSINEIAEETNLLSLNASIEAARAGDAGRGFSVVAEEIRKLADQSLASANQIGNIINEIISNTHDVVNTAKQAEEIVKSQETVVTNTGDSFTEINDHISTLMDSLNAITKDMENMGSARMSTLESIENISSISAETVSCSSSVVVTANKQLDAVTQLDAAATILNKRSEELSELLNAFTIS